MDDQMTTPRLNVELAKKFYDLFNNNKETIDRLRTYCKNKKGMCDYCKVSQNKYGYPCMYIVYQNFYFD